MSGNSEVVETHVGSVGEELIRGGAAIVKIENDSLFAIAQLHKRDEQMILEQAIAELKMVPHMAARIFYALPYKNHVRGCDDRANCDCPTRYVRGMGIKGSLNLARRWGNCSSTVRVTDEDEEWIRLEGVFIDFETRARFSKPRVVSRFRNYGNRRVKLYDRQWEQLVAAEASKAQRNAILDGLPDYLVESYYQEARGLAIETERGEGSEPVHLRVLSSFVLLNVDKETLERYLGHTIEEITDDEIANLRGIRNAIADKEQTAGEIFGFKEEEEPPGSGGESSAEQTDTDGAAERVAGSGATTTGGARSSSRKKSPRKKGASTKEDPASVEETPPGPTDESQGGFQLD